MSIIKAKYCEIEVQEQTTERGRIKISDVGAKYMVVLSYEPEDKFSKEIISVVLTNNKPHIKTTIDLGDRIVNTGVPLTEKPKDITTPEGLLGE